MNPTVDETADHIAAAMRVLNVVLTAEGVAPLVEAGELTAEDVLLASEAFEEFSDALDAHYGHNLWLHS